MKFTKEDLISMVQDQINSAMGGTDFTESLKKTLQSMVSEMQKGMQIPFSAGQTKHVISSLPFSRIDGDYLTTKQGSVINLKNKSNPWLVVSDDLGSWVTDFAKYLKTNAASKALMESTDSAGGYLVPEEFKALMIMYDMAETAIWQRATVWPMAGEKIAFPKLIQDPDVDSSTFDHFAGVSFAWTDEGAEKEETEPNFGLVEMIVHELSGYSELTNILLDDSVINLMNYLTRLFRDAWYWYTDRSFLRGNGAKQPMGVLNDPAVLTVFRKTSSTVGVDDVIAMDAKLPAVFDPGAVWFYTKKIRAALRGQRATAGGELLLQETFKDISEGYSAQLLGKPAVLVDGKLPTMGQFGDLVLGNWSQYYVGFRQDFVMDSSRHYQFRKNRTALRCSGRVDGQTAIPQAFVVLDDSLS